MNYFITGATGFIGGEIARQLVGAGHRVIALVRDPDRGAELASLGVVLARGDITDRESMREPMIGVDGVFHVAGWYRLGAKNKGAGMRVNVDGTRNVLELMKELKIPKGVYTSTVAVFSDTHGKIVDETYRYDGPHLSEYDRTKWIAHYEVALPMMEAGLPLVVVQPGLVYGPGDTSPSGNAIREYLCGKLPLLPRKTAFCWGYVEDVARGHVLAMERGTPGESYILAGPPHTMIEAFEIAERITGIEAPSLRVGPGVLRFLSKIMSVVGAVVRLPESYRAEALRVIAGVTYLGSNQKAKRDLGYRVRSLEDGLRLTLPALMREVGATRSEG